MYTYTPLTSQHLDAVLALYAEYRVPTATPAMIAAWLDNHPSVGAWDHETLIGFGYTQHYAPEVLEIDNIYVKTSHRNTKIGQQMLSHIERTARDQGYHGIMLNNALSYKTKEARQTPRSFYLKNGYTIALETSTTTLYTKLLGQEPT